MKLADGLHLVRNGPEGKRQRAPLLIDVGPEATYPRHADRKVRFFPLGKFLDLPRSHDLLCQELEILRLERRQLQSLEIPIQANGWRPPDLEQQVGRVPLDHLGNRILEVEAG